MFPLKKIVTSNTNDLLDDWLFADYYQPVIEVGNKVNNNEKKNTNKHIHFCIQKGGRNIARKFDWQRKTKEAIKNGHSIENGNIGYTRWR